MRQFPTVTAVHSECGLIIIFPAVPLLIYPLSIKEYFYIESVWNFGVLVVTFVTLGPAVTLNALDAAIAGPPSAASAAGRRVMRVGVFYKTRFRFPVRAFRAEAAARAIFFLPAAP